MMYVSLSPLGGRLVQKKKPRLTCLLEAGDRGLRGSLLLLSNLVFTHTLLCPFCARRWSRRKPLEYMASKRRETGNILNAICKRCDAGNSGGTVHSMQAVRHRKHMMYSMQPVNSSDQGEGLKWKCLVHYSTS